MNTITVNGEKINIGATPLIIRQVGFDTPADVRRVANKNSKGEPKVRLDDVADYFTHNRAY